jgi:subtilisin family serine protease
MLLLIVAAVGCVASAAHAFPNTQSDAAKQWYLLQDQAWSAWRTLPRLATVKVAVIDSGIDAGNPAFAGRIAAGRSFVGGSWRTDSAGHGTFVAGIIAAGTTDGVGTAGIAFNAKLVIAKVVNDVGVIPPTAEADAIRWAADQGARVINLSFGGQRDPKNQELNFYSTSERNAVEYAYAKGAVVVAAVGNGSNAPTEPWPYADWPAALPNVVGVAALNRNGSVPNFSNRDPRYVDIAAPGAGIFSTIPRNLEQLGAPGCNDDPYSNCGSPEFRAGNGTSFAAPQVAAAAALLIGVDPSLKPDQVEWLLERSATDMTPADGCDTCSVGRDALTGWGRLDVARAVGMLRDGVRLPPPDRLEPDVDTGSESHTVGALPELFASSEDFWDDAADVFSLRLHPGQQLRAVLEAENRAAFSLRLWLPGTPSLMAASARNLATQMTIDAGSGVLTYRPVTAGVYYLEVVDHTPMWTRALYRLSLSAPVRAGARRPTG